MIAVVSNYVSKGVQNYNDTTKKMTWFKTNFNMPVEDYMAANSPFTRYQGAWNFIGGPTTSFDLSGFVPGYEICVGNSIYDFENDSASPVNINTTATIGWYSPSLSPLFTSSSNLSYSSLPSGYYIEFWLAANTGCAGWEVNSNDTYHYRASASGSPSIPVVDISVAMSNVPSTTQLGSTKPGHIWVEGNDLCYINANQWKHTIVGATIGNPGADPGYIWIDSSNLLHWIGSDGQDYVNTFFVKQFASFFSGGATGTVFAGTSKAGYLWVDSEFGDTHLAYIGYDGYKYLTGSGDSPYI
jgi:hypothetical protein